MSEYTTIYLRKMGEPLLKSDDARHLLEKLPGRKFLVDGNYDGSIRSF